MEKMQEFYFSLILSYFKESKENYSILEITKILGLSLLKTENLISILIDKNYINYTDNLLQLTEAGNNYLANNFQFSISFTKPEITNAPWPIDKIYIPKNFTY